MVELAPIATLTVAWWLSWLLGGVAAFASVVWVLTFFALRSDDEPSAPGDQAASGDPRDPAAG